MEYIIAAGFLGIAVMPDIGGFAVCINLAAGGLWLAIALARGL